MEFRPTLTVLLLTLLALTAWSCQKSPIGKAGQEVEPEETTYHAQLGDEIPADELQDTTQVKPKEKDFAASDNPLAKFEYTWTNKGDMPDIVIIVDDFGSSGALLDGYAKLPAEVVFAVLPDLAFTRRAGEIASQYNHEVLIHAPMQPENSKENPGATYIKATDTAETINQILDGFYTQLPMAIGVNNHMGSAATASRETMQAVLKYLNSKGLVFMDSYTSGKSVGPSLARSLGFPALKRDIFLDVPDNTDATLASKIESLGKYKGRREPVIIITHCHNKAKLEALTKFISQIQGMGLKLTTIARAKQLAV